MKFAKFFWVYLSEPMNLQDVVVSLNIASRMLHKSSSVF
ncbi:unnamed protein product [Brassica rapa]|uniref:Uncharacterized protein n=2 Tax=Brassica TaxID=3705 RepID=A0A8D9GY07_BRACM|nr:unnamed protein product [Brassica napus]CAG7889229.1 unnamed protein product [Brassica rapa]